MNGYKCQYCDNEHSVSTTDFNRGYFLGDTGKWYCLKCEKCETEKVRMFQIAPKECSDEPVIYIPQGYLEDALLNDYNEIPCDFHVRIADITIKELSKLPEFQGW